MFVITTYCSKDNGTLFISNASTENEALEEFHTKMDKSVFKIVTMTDECEGIEDQLALVTLDWSEEEGSKWAHAIFIGKVNTEGFAHSAVCW